MRGGTEGRGERGGGGEGWENWGGVFFWLDFFDVEDKFVVILFLFFLFLFLFLFLFFFVGGLLVEGDR